MNRQCHAAWVQICNTSRIQIDDIFAYYLRHHNSKRSPSSGLEEDGAMEEDIGKIDTFWGRSQKIEEKPESREKRPIIKETEITKKIKHTSCVTVAQGVTLAIKLLRAMQSGSN